MLVIFRYDVALSGLSDFLAKLGEAGNPRFSSPVMPKSVRLFRSSVPGPDTAGLTLMIEYQAWRPTCAD